jgi:hypothetical protein
MTTQQLNSKLEIKKVNNLKFASKNQYILFSGHALFIAGKGFVRFADSGKQANEFKIPYKPAGGFGALKSIIKGGGFIDYSKIEFTNPSIN